MSTRQISFRTRIDPKTLCPSCDSKGRAVKPVTIESLVIEAARARVHLLRPAGCCPSRR